MDEAGPSNRRPIEKRKRASGRDVGLSKLVAQEKMAAVVKGAELRELVAMKVARVGAESRKELHFTGLKSQEDMATRQLAQDREFRDRDRDMADRRLRQEQELANRQFEMVQRKLDSAELLELIKAYREDGCKPSLARRKAKNVLAGRESDEDEYMQLY
jgi:aryl carrier-like protein